MPRKIEKQSYARRIPRRKSKSRILVLCGGEETEPLYFSELKNWLRNPLVKVVIEGHRDDPLGLVDRAIKKKAEAEERSLRERSAFHRYDEVWCVLDVDDHHRLPEARKKASLNAINLAISDPCFELWAILHLWDHTSKLSTKEAQRLLKKRFPGYHKELPFSKLSPYYFDAVQRAKDLDARGKQGNPSTGVYRLTERIRQEGRGPTAPPPVATRSRRG